MTPEAQRIAIAELCGWREAFPGHGQPHPETRKGGILLPYNWVNERTHERRMELPDYLSDLNAMHEAEKTLTPTQHRTFKITLVGMLTDKGMELCVDRLIEANERAVSAPAAQRAEAFLRTVGKWDDTKCTS